MALTLAVVFQIAALLMGGCQTPTPDSINLGKVSDTTEDLHHRLKIGMFEPETDPVIVLIEKKTNLNKKLKLPFYDKRVPHAMLRISWARGKFWVQADDHALVVIYMDQEAIFSHVQIATSDKFSLVRKIREKIRIPIR